MFNIIVKPNPPYYFQKMVHKLSLDPQYKVDQERGELSFAMRIKLEQDEQRWKKGIVLITNKGRIERPEKSIQFIGDELNKEEQSWLVEQLDARFGWTTDVLQLVVDLATEYGETMDYAGHTYAFFPTPEQLAQVDVEELRQRKFSRRKAEYITDLAKKIASGELDLETLSQEDNETIIQELTKARGVGVWTVECFLLFGLGRANLFPAGDLGIQKALQQLLALPKRPTAEECREWAMPYEAWGTYVALYLWESLR